MAIYKLSDDFYEDSYTLIAIHGSLDGYRLAYFLNATFQIKLQRLKADVSISEGVSMPAYKWFDEHNEVSWSLIKNKVTIKQAQTGTSLFEHSQRVYFIPEYSKVDYFVMIEEEGGYRKALEAINKINKLPGVITAYKIEEEQLKSKNNLIFLTNA
ncbi:IPExxxVDY family protein [Joostella sp. CR20]|uniref:IPExxxVDY family protein n=1 Tax=Joostella sp. CR20 TaxID=2804312 RepID=UPI00313BC912